MDLPALACTSNLHEPHQNKNHSLNDKVKYLRSCASQLLFHLIVNCFLFTFKRFLELLKAGRSAEVDTMLQDENFKNYMIAQDQLSFVFLQVV